MVILKLDQSRIKNQQKLDTILARGNQIAQKIITKESQRRICKDKRCHHMLHEHVKNQGVCFILHCTCTKFIK